MAPEFALALTAAMTVYIRRARFRCWDCKHEWTQRPGMTVRCPRCGYNYCTWLNHPNVLKNPKDWP
jgi:Zn finger protein HypA/HybF involved in hydrogenase expression